MTVLLRIADRLRRIVWRVFGPRTVGVRALVVDGEGRVLLVQHSYGPRAWHLPGGGVKRRETIESALRREVREEVGIEVTGPVHLLGTYSNLGEGKSDHISVFVVEQWLRGEQHDAEIAASGFFALPELPEMTSRGTRRRIDEWAKGHVTAFEW